MVLHAYGSSDPVELPVVVQVALNLLILRSAGASDNENVFGTTGLDDAELVGLRPHYSLRECRTEEGGRRLTEPGRFQAMALLGDTVEITWSPAADNATERSRLEVRKGIKYHGVDMVPKISRVCGLLYDDVFDEEAAA